ncbi:aryl-alcohol dehydrogenase-like predicted oxidoreductase [Kribbella steppae]|uniref:Aryl-alcohol dehydrogenase-like predicted oxidoreductase n=1 Tax=Kribbella steppae TaxID=2512223 RepID=A0A4R2HFA0_9ACTN|nr:aldo/keto reductase [Kribbella steppae]TCO26266.1 aryl-alcohol dehydrogenase-like predicted oxidoreductase [Kribbella steppae]
MEKRVLGRVGIEVSPVGFGCWAIGGPFSRPDGDPLGWGEVDDDESVRAIRRAVELGVTFFDTADVYGAGHSERVLGKALEGMRDQVVIATKWGNTFDESTATMHDQDDSAAYVHKAVRASLERLGTDYIDLYQLHFDTSNEVAQPLREACEELVREGLIRSYAWSTDTVTSAEFFAEGEHCSAVQHEASVLHDAPEFFALCERADLASINRTPLGMGLLGRRDASRPATGADIRTLPPSWLRYFGKGGVPTPEWWDKVSAIRDVLESDGRTLAQGALAWLWARSPRTVPIPGFRTVAQAEENARAMEFGPLRDDQMAEIATLLGR